MTADWPELSDPGVLSRTEMLGHLRPAERYSVRLVSSEQRQSLVMRRYLISAASYRGREIAVFLRLCLYDAQDPRIVCSIPGGRGAFPDATVWWLAAHFKRNQVAIDWIGRGNSPEHPELRCDYDPIYMASDAVRDAYLFHNIGAIWAGLNWLFHTGLQPVDLVGGSWGGVFCYLLAALDPRIERIFPTFGCGGMSFAAIEKRSMWDAAIEEMGPHRTRQWRQAFDPLLRMNEIAARTYYETATNDKFFSIDMAMATWKRVKNPCFLSLAANQDHTMNPRGTQPYIVQQLGERQHLECRAISQADLVWDPRSAEVVLPPGALGDADEPVLYWSEQESTHGNMSREWHRARAVRSTGDGTVFPLEPTSATATLLYFLDCRLRVDEFAIHASTPIHAATGTVDSVRPRHSHSVVLNAEGEDPWAAPVGDKTSPALSIGDQGWVVRFLAAPRARLTRFGLRPWLLPRWEAIEVVLAEPVDAGMARLELVLSRRYQRFDEEAVAHSFADARTSPDGHCRKLRFPRTGFTGSVVVEERFRRHELPDAAAILDDFDSVGIVDRTGSFAGEIALMAISIQSS